MKQPLTIFAPKFIKNNNMDKLIDLGITKFFQLIEYVCSLYLLDKISLNHHITF